MNILEFMAELLDWIAVHCTGVSNVVASEWYTFDKRKISI